MLQLLGRYLIYRPCDIHIPVCKIQYEGENGTVDVRHRPFVYETVGTGDSSQNYDTDDGRPLIGDDLQAGRMYPYGWKRRYHVICRLCDEVFSLHSR